MITPTIIFSCLSLCLSGIFLALGFSHYNILLSWLSLIFPSLQHSAYLPQMATNSSNPVSSANGIYTHLGLLSPLFMKTWRRADINSACWRNSVPLWQLYSDPIIYSLLATCTFSLIISIWKFTIIFPVAISHFLIRTSRTTWKEKFFIQENKPQSWIKPSVFLTQGKKVTWTSLISFGFCPWQLNLSLF